MFYNTVRLKKKGNPTDCQTIDIPYSKSISNRLLIIKYLANSDKEIKNLSSSDDTVLLQNFLQQTLCSNHGRFYCKNAGTTLRFLLACLSLKPGTWILEADERMKKRPLLPLTEILNSLGADIKISNNEDIFPITINGKTLSSNKTINLENNFTSQIISALLLISPYIKGGITVAIPKKQVSMPYINMTIQLVNQFGGSIEKHGNTLVCREKAYNFYECGVEKDWSSASFFYCLASILKTEELRINCLQTSVLQGDSVCRKLFEMLGIRTKFDKNGAILSYDKALISANKGVTFDLSDFPDLFCPLITSCWAMGIKTEIKNIQSLRVKESDRVKNMIEQLNKLDDRCFESENSVFVNPITKKRFTETALKKNKTTIYLNNQPLYSNETPFYFRKDKEEKNIILKTYNDHRIAMSLSLLALIYDGIEIENPACTEKSFPEFWTQMQKFCTTEFYNTNL